jgi:hypothetical protein
MAGRWWAAPRGLSSYLGPCRSVNKPWLGSHIWTPARELTLLLPKTKHAFGCGASDGASFFDNTIERIRFLINPCTDLVFQAFELVQIKGVTNAET